MGQGPGGKKRRMSNQHEVGNTVGARMVVEEAKIALTRTPLRNPESIISDEEDTPSDISKSDGHQQEKKSSKTRKPLKTALSLDNHDD